MYVCEERKKGRGKESTCEHGTIIHPCVRGTPLERRRPGTRRRGSGGAHDLVALHARFYGTSKNATRRGPTAPRCCLCETDAHDVIGAMRDRGLFLFLFVCAAVHVLVVAPAPTVPGDADPGAPIVSTPVEPKTSMLKLSPEELTKASLPWEGMDKPAMMRLGNFPRTEPWDTMKDSTQHVPFGNYHVMPARPPPFIPGDVDKSTEQKQVSKLETNWMRQVQTPSIPAIGPAFYGHNLKPAGYYPNPLKKYIPNLVGSGKASFLEIDSSIAETVISGHHRRPHSAYRAKRHFTSAYKAKRARATTTLVDLGLATHHHAAVSQTASATVGSAVAHKANAAAQTKYGPQGHQAMIQATYAGGAHVGGESAGSEVYGVGVPAPGVRAAPVPGKMDPHLKAGAGYTVQGVIQPHPTIVTPMSHLPSVSYVYRGTQRHSPVPYGRPTQVYAGTVPAVHGPAPGTSANMAQSYMPPRFQQMQASLIHTNQAQGGSAPWFAPPVLGGQATVNPSVAVIGEDQSMLAAPDRQQFVGMSSFSPRAGGSPLPVRSYADDHPSPYQAAPTWPPAPPEPLFPLKHHSSYLPRQINGPITPPLPGTYARL